MTNEQIYHDALLAIATFFNGNPMKWPKSHDACSAMVEIADKALNAGETNVHEPGCGGIKCVHCNGKGTKLQVFDAELFDGWSPEDDPCETCNGAGRITTVEQYLKTLPADWLEDSSLETWFPLTAEEHDRYKRCLYRANGRLIQLGQEPEKLDYPSQDKCGIAAHSGDDVLTPDPTTSPERQTGGVSALPPANAVKSGGVG